MADLKNLLEQCRSNLKNVHFNIYNAIISGSVELRSLNMHYVFPKLKTQVEGRTKIGEYAYMYDNPGAGGGKYNEPNYDGITCLISLLDDEDFSKNFCLKKVNLAKTEGNWGKGNFTNDHKDCTKLLMIPEKEEGSLCNYVEKNRADLFGKNYSGSNYKHIYILSPLSEESLRYILNIIANADNDNKVIIHYQGESHLGDCDEKILPARNEVGANKEYLNYIGLTPKGGVFANSFNYVGGMKHGIIFRDLMQHCQNIYTVCVNNKVTEYIEESLQTLIEPFEGKVDAATGTPIKCEKRLPKIYKFMNDWIFNNIYLNGSSQFGLKFDNVHMIEDLYDKDNSTAIEIMSRFSNNNLKLLLVGKECSKVLLDGKEATIINRRVKELCSGKDERREIKNAEGKKIPNPDKGKVIEGGKKCLPPIPGRVSDFPTGMFFRLLKFGPPPTSHMSYWPIFLPSNGLSQKPDDVRTLNENKLMASAILHLLSDRGFLNIDLIGNEIYKRDHKSIAFAGNNVGEVAPFNELLFVPGLYFALNVISGDKENRQLSDITTKFDEFALKLPDKTISIERKMDGGGNDYNFILNPINGNRININSNQARKLLKNYILALNKNGWGI